MLSLTYIFFLAHYTATPSHPPNLGSSGGSGHFLSTPAAQAHIFAGLFKRDICYLIHLLIKSIEFGRFPDRGSWKHVHNIHTGFIVGKHLPRATESMLSTLLRDGRGGSAGWRQQGGHSGIMIHLDRLFPGAQPTRTPQGLGV